jgi:hypothetical protein
MGWDISGGVCCVVQGRRRLGIMKRNGIELMRRWEERRWSVGDEHKVVQRERSRCLISVRRAIMAE